ncbi:Putative S-adenosyl-L-methionine-dependent methyltransferase superfamily [Colletotrichum destructivum]|uniref:S-adenosyl-L-methionine-dependent methyltransferase superfamily n=1 Tax=Colletotrichum destructivum TaxID=34406 RepID=A0AAX4I3H8_9PEZI|nr:Putative S-adenosyl-L-methionine-dependent methyltransferase superfamily [Colletotrichum destructivum]
MSQDNQPVEIVVDDGLDDDQSEVGDSMASSSTSLRESLLEYRIENGRTYHKYKDGKYIFPNDERELERLDLTHALWFLVSDDKLGLAPPCQDGAKVGRVLDVGTGTGIWALDFGDEHPEAEVIATDLSPTLPSYVPPNVKFQVDDAEEPWTFSQPFQYIHSRVITSGISDWHKYLRRCYDNLEPGGWVEVQEIDLYTASDDDTLKPDSALMKWCHLLQQASDRFGSPFVRIPTLKEVMLDVGFVDVSLSVSKWPTNAWPKEPKWKEIGIWNNENVLSGIEGFSMAALTRGHEWTREEVNVFLIDVRKDLKDRNIHAYWPVYFITGRRPDNVVIPQPAPESSVGSSPESAASPPASPPVSAPVQAQAQAAS